MNNNITMPYERGNLQANDVGSKQPMIHSALDHLDKSIGCLNDTIDKLRTRLVVISRPRLNSPPQPNDKKEVCDIPMLKRLEDQNDMLVNLAGELQLMLGSLEI
jgi:hypothetical protein